MDVCLGRIVKVVPGYVLPEDHEVSVMSVAAGSGIAGIAVESHRDFRWRIAGCRFYRCGFDITHTHLERFATKRARMLPSGVGRSSVTPESGGYSTPDWMASSGTDRLIFQGLPAIGSSLEQVREHRGRPFHLL